MCGIAGIISSNPQLVQRQRLQQMADSLQHRGPDGDGFWINDDNSVGLAHRRLAIIDLSDKGIQPLQYLHYTISFNGEIYNFIELKEELQHYGYRFYTHTDTEIIPAAFDHWGKESLNKLDGMFAFALWNGRDKELLLARDRFGEKPLYYHADYRQRGRFEQFLFASEMKALWVAGVMKNANGTMMLNYLTLGYVQNPYKKTETFFNDILSLPPGCYLTINPQEGRVQMKKWFTLKGEVNNGRFETESENGANKMLKRRLGINRFIPFVEKSGIDREAKRSKAVEAFRELLFTSVQRRLRSDVSLGVSLSGGLDSSSIAATIKKLYGNDFSPAVFTATFPGFEKDESVYSRQVAGALGVQQYTITPTVEDFIEGFQQFMYCQEEPVQSASAYTQYMVYQLAKQNNVTVLLDGQGADEVLGGYPAYTHWFLQELLRKDFYRYRIEKHLLNKNGFVKEWNWKNYLASLSPEKTSLLLHKRTIHNQNAHPYIHPDFKAHFQNTDTLRKPVVRKLEDIMYHQTCLYGLETLLRYADRNSMAHSREVRLPFLQHELVSFVYSLSSDYKMHNGYTKWILRESVKDLLPQEITWRKGKIGYEPPQKEWMENKAMQEMIVESKKKLVSEKVLTEKSLHTSIKSQSAQEANNYDWQYLSAASALH